jgi:hypothetical protein
MMMRNVPSHRPTSARAVAAWSRRVRTRVQRVDQRLASVGSRGHDPFTHPQRQPIAGHTEQHRGDTGAVPFAPFEAPQMYNSITLEA